MMYIHQLRDWPTFRWNRKDLEVASAVRYPQGRLIARMEGLGLALRAEASLQGLTEEVLKSSEIEGEILDKDQVRSSIARRLGIDIGALTPADRHVEGVVGMLLDAPWRITPSRSPALAVIWRGIRPCSPPSRCGLGKILVGRWRLDGSGPMQVMDAGRSAARKRTTKLRRGSRRCEMLAFLRWFNAHDNMDLVLEAGVAHLWFVTIKLLR